MSTTKINTAKADEIAKATADEGKAADQAMGADPTDKPASRRRRPAAKPAAKKATAKPAKAKPEAPKAPRTTAATEGEQVCRACAKSLPLTKFPTKAAKDGIVGREDRCRSCRDEARKAKQAAKAKVA